MREQKSFMNRRKPGIKIRPTHEEKAAENSGIPSSDLLQDFHLNQY